MIYSSGYILSLEGEERERQEKKKRQAKHEMSILLIAIIRRII